MPFAVLRVLPLKNKGPCEEHRTCSSRGGGFGSGTPLKSAGSSKEQWRLRAAKIARAGAGPSVAAGIFGGIENALGLVVQPGDAFTAGGLACEGFRGAGEAGVGVAEKDEVEDGGGILGGGEVGVGAELIGGCPESFFQVGGVGGHGGS